MSSLVFTQGQASEIFQWRDADGRLHFGDKPPIQHTAENLSSQYASTALPFDVRIEGVGYSIPADLRQRIELAISKTFLILRQSLNIDYQDARDFRVVIYGDQHEFRRYQQTVAPILHLAAGFYSSANNQITTYNLGDSRQMLSLLTHEAVHAILHSSRVNMPIWLHEGLATYCESLELHGLSADVPLAPHVLYALHQRPADETAHRAMLSANQRDWLAANGPGNHSYALSGATVFFLMDSPQGRELLRKMLTQNTVINATVPIIDESWPGGFSTFHQQFAQWFNGLRRHPPKHRY